MPLLFEVTAVPNGILLGAVNYSDADARFDWARSYLVLPNGDSCTARSLGFWEVGRAAASGAEPTNTVGARRRACAVISAAPYADELDSVTVATICLDWRRRGDRGGWPEALYRIGDYWPTEVTTAGHGSGARVSMVELASFVKANDNLELVYVYEQLGTQHQCRVVFSFRSIHAVAARERRSRRQEIELFDPRDKYIYEIRRDVWRER